MQLPPVLKKGYTELSDDRKLTASPTFTKFFEYVSLQENIRQRDETEFQEFLNKIKSGSSRELN